MVFHVGCKTGLLAVMAAVRFVFLLRTTKAVALFYRDIKAPKRWAICSSIEHRWQCLCGALSLERTESNFTLLSSHGHAPT